MFRFRSGTFPSVEGRCDAGADVLGRFSGRARLDAGGVRRTVRSGRPSNAIPNSKIRRGVGQTERPDYSRFAGLSGFDLIEPRRRQWRATVDQAIPKSYGRYADPGQRSNRSGPQAAPLYAQRQGPSRGRGRFPVHRDGRWKPPIRFISSKNSARSGGFFLTARLGIDRLAVFWSEKRGSLS